MCTWKYVVLRVLFLLLLQIHQHVDCEVIYITPSLNTSCPQRSCSTFTQYTSNPNPGLNITLVLLPGNHGLEIPFSVANKGIFLMIASFNTDVPHVTCISTGNLSLSSIQLAMISGITFSGCGHNMARSIVNFTLRDTSFVNSTTIHNGAIWSVSSSTTMILENCTFANNVIQSGGTLSINKVSNLMIHMCMFTNNEVRQKFRDGGVLLITETNSTISQSIFFNNQVRRGGEGGAVYISGGNAAVSESTFISNQVNGSSGDGGALYIKNANSVVVKSTFTSNQVSEREEGGAVYIRGGNITVSKSNFTGNQAGDGGALYILQANSSVTKSIFTNNQAKGYNCRGGALCIWNALNLIINNSIFIQNQANGSSGDGGAAYIWDTSLIISKSVFIKNNANYQGGAVHINSLKSRLAIISASNFTENQIKDRNGDGGALYISKTKLSVYNCMFTSNHADGGGGAMYIKDANSTIDDSIFRNNQASGLSGVGGAVYFRVHIPSNSISLTLNLCIFVNNKARQRKRAGTVHVHAGSFRHEGGLSVSHCQFYENSGEAIYTYNISKLSINSSTFTNHSNGRASIFSESPTRRSSYGEILVNQNSFIGNTGAIKSINIRFIKIYSSNFKSNTVYDRQGGVIYATGKDIDVLLSHSMFSKNTAVSCGVMSISTSQTYVAKVNLASNTFSYNIATGQYSAAGGGVACFRNALITVDDNNFNGNLANFDGGCFSVNESFITIERSIFTGNSAFNGGGIGHIVNSSLAVRDSTFINNSALNIGGVFAIRKGLAAIDKNSFYNNRADGEGGVLYFYSNPDDYIFVKIEDNRFLDNEAVISGRLLYTQNYTIDDLFQTCCICYCSTAYVISRTFAATHNSNNCTVCSLLNERFNDIATCSAEVTSTSEPGIQRHVRETTIAATCGSVVAVILIAALAIVAAVMIYKRFKTNYSQG